MEKSKVHFSSNQRMTNSLRRKFMAANLIGSILICAAVILAEALLKSLWLVAIIGILLTAVSCTGVYLRVSQVVGPITALRDRIAAMAESCDYSSEVPYFETNDEVQALCDSVCHLKEVQNCHMADLMRVLKSIAGNNLDVEISCEYPGDFHEQKLAMLEIIHSLNHNISQISVGSSEIAAATSNIAQGVQVVSQGTNAQSGAVEELTLAVVKLHEEAQKNAQAAEQASAISNNAGGHMVAARSRMQDLLDAMKEIHDTSKKIGKVIKTVDDIAFQTNILALNASVEAARAGVAGKGFSVVANEVRNLANKSAEASQGTAGLLESAIRAVANGVQIAEETSQTLDEVMGQAKLATDLTNSIADDSVEQEQAIKRLTVGLEQISRVVQDNCSVAQEGAAASEELEAQARELRTFVERYHVKPHISKQ